MVSHFSPPYIAFTGNGLLFGEAAKRHAGIDPRNTVFGLRNLIGRSFSDVQADVEKLPFRVVSKENRPVVQVDVAGKTEQYTPEQLCSMLLVKTRETAGSYLGSAVGNAVITVPTSFGERQREAIKEAAEGAGLHVPRLVTEPTAAGIAHQLEGSDDEKRFLVYDLGDSLSLHVLVVDQNVFEYLATADEVSLAASGCSPEHQPCMQDPYGSGRPLGVVGHSQAVFSNESLMAAMLEGSLRSVERVLREANVTKGEIDDLVLVGGSPYLPQFQAQLEHYFGFKASNVTSEVDSVVVGAALQAQILFYGDYGQSYAVFDILPLSLGIETVGGVMSKIIPRYSSLPTRKRHYFTTDVDNQISVLIKVYDGERVMARDNAFLGQFELNVPASPRGVPCIEVYMTLDTYYELSVEVRSLVSGDEESIRMNTAEGGRYHDARVDYLIEQAEKYGPSDAVLRQLLPDTRALQGRRPTDHRVGEGTR